MKYLLFGTALFFILILAWTLCAMQSSANSPTTPNFSLLELSEKLLYSVKTETPTDNIEQALYHIAMPTLIAGLPNDNARMTFWINTYNAWYQILALREKKTRPKIFTDELIPIAGAMFSLDDIEHGILRKYRWKYSLGYFPQFCPSKTIKQLSVTEIDYRIHFALNCGARSCPPIAFYTYNKIGTQLETAAFSFLNAETEIDESAEQLHVSKIMQWFKGDFGGSKGIKKVLSKYLKKDLTEYSLQYKEYDWDARLRNFSE